MNLCPQKGNLRFRAAAGEAGPSPNHQGRGGIGTVVLTVSLAAWGLLRGVCEQGKVLPMVTP